MTGNAELLRKADLVLSDLSNNGGLLQPEDSASCIRKLIKPTALIGQVRVVEMLAPQRKINKIGFGSRIMRKATSGTALTQNQRSKPTTEVITLSTKEVIAEVRLPYDVLEDNIERAQAATNSASNTGAQGGLKDTLIALIADRAALDLEELGLLGDTTYTNGGDQDDQDYLSMFDGWLKLAGTSNTVDAGNVTVTKTLFRDGMKAMPVQYLRNKGTMAHFVSQNNEIMYRDTLADRVGGLGDSMVTGTNPVPAFGVPVRPVPLLPDDKGFFGDPMNLIFGIQRQVSMEFDKDITSRVYIIVLTARVAFQVEETLALVKYTNIAAS